MGKPDKNHKTEYDDIQAVFARRDRNRAAQSPQDYPEVPEFLNEPRRIRGGEGYSLESMRQVHEGEAVYDGGRGQARQPTYVQEPYYEPPVPVRQGRGKKRKKHRLLRFLLRLAGLLLVLALTLGLISVLLAEMPQTDAPLGPRKQGCCAVLLCGADEGGARTDTMLLLFLDRDDKQARLLSLPRDTMVNRDNPVPKLNGAYGANGKGRKGMEVLLGYVKDLIGYKPDGCLLLELEDFAALVDAMGGVTYDVPMDMEYKDPTQELYIDLKAGTQTLNGQQALWLVRFRSGYDAADLERVRVQRDFLGAAVSQWKSLSRLPRLPYAALLLMKHAQTDLSYRNLCWLALTLARCEGGMDSDTLPGEAVWINGGSYYAEDREDAAALVNEKYNPYDSEIQADDLHPYGY